MQIGIVEGFYGPLWDKITRLSMIEFMYKNNMNIYIYGPKWDPYHRDRWYSPYPSNYVEMFVDLIDYANRRGIEIVYAISPGLTIDYSSKTDLNKLVKKLERMMEIGFSSLAIFLDDIPPVLRGKGFKSLAEAQASLVNYVDEELSPDKIMFCPTYYWKIKEDYLRELGEILESNVYIMWTGQAIVPIKITLDDVKAFYEVTGRKAFIWDNYPVNDYFLLRGYNRLHLGPFEGRDPRIWEYISGYVANPMIEAEASKIPLYTLSRFYVEKQNYDPEKSLDEAIRSLFPEEEYDTVKYFVELNKASPFNPYADKVPTEKDIQKLSNTLEELMNIRNKDFLRETRWIREKLKSISEKLSGKSVKMNHRIQTAGDYYLDMDREEMIFFFGEVIKTRKIWI